MSPGPLRRLAGAVGLVALVPTAWLLASGAITLVDAAVRATVTLVVVVALGRVTGWVVGELAGSFERDGEEPDESPGGPPRKAAAASPADPTRQTAGGPRDQGSQAEEPRAVPATR